MASAIESAALADDLKNKVGKLGLKDEAGEELEEGEIVDEDAGGVHPSVKVERSLHPLENTWKFWFDNGAAKSKSTDWGSTMNPVHSFSTVEDFWGLYNNINIPSKFPVGSDFYCFKEKIEPKWEDPLCANGGKWTAAFSKGRSDAAWLYTLLAIIGEQFDYGEEICGAVINVRGRQEKVSLWTKNASNEIAQTTIGAQWKMMIDYHEVVGYIVHEDAKRDRNAKNKYTV
uniref:eIF-4F 25 kDa subunit n=1 Tax=Kalanchoe fedtschenkoi TaxID=63787 RepID=A0A7N0T3V7_KALFE